MASWLWRTSGERDVACADGRTPRQRYTAAPRSADDADLARLRRILLGPGRVEVGPAQRVDYPALEAWTAIRVGNWIWQGSAPLRVRSIRSGSADARCSARCAAETPGSVQFLPGEIVEIAKDVAPLVVATAATTVGGLYAVDPVEHAMLEEVVRDLGEYTGTADANSRRADMGDSGPESDGSTTVGATGEYDRCRDVESLAPLHQMLPYGSQFRDTASSAGHAWVNAEIRDDAQVRRAVEQIEAAIRRCPGATPLVLSAYSDGSVTGRGVAGSAAIVIETLDGEVVATIHDVII